MTSDESPGQRAALGSLVQITFGDHNGKQVERLLIDQPGWVLWMLRQPTPTGRLAAAAGHARRCIENFNRRPYVETCYGDDCDLAATRMSLYATSNEPYFWCASCSPYARGAERGALKIATTYESVVGHVEANVTTRDALRYTADLLVTAKGLPKPRTDAKLVAFFAK